MEWMFQKFKRSIRKVLVCGEIINDSTYMFQKPVKDADRWSSSSRQILMPMSGGAFLPATGLARSSFCGGAGARESRIGGEKSCMLTCACLYWQGVFQDMLIYSERSWLDIRRLKIIVQYRVPEDYFCGLAPPRMVVLMLRNFILFLVLLWYVVYTVDSLPKKAQGRTVNKWMVIEPVNIMLYLVDLCVKRHYFINGILW